MRTLHLPLALLLATAACVTEEVDDHETLGTGEGALLSSSERTQLAGRIRAQFASRNIAPVPSATIPGSSSRRAALIALGQALVFDKILSDNKDISCMTCHPPALGGDDDRHLSAGVRGTGLGQRRQSGLVIPRNAPSLFNLHALDSLFWDGRVEKLPDGTYRTPAGAQLTPQMTAVFEFGALSAIGLFPVTNRDEMREHVLDGRFDDLTAVPDDNFTEIWNRVMIRLRAVPRYRELFGDAYPSWPGSRTSRINTMSFAHASNAMAAFYVDRFTSKDSPWDAFVAGDDNAFRVIEHLTLAHPPVISERSVMLGAERFLSTCANCHNGPTLSDNRFHNTALAQLGPGQGDGDGFDDFGRARVTADAHARCGTPGSGASCRYAFRTTPLHNVALTGPFGHAGEIGRVGNASDFIDDLHADIQDLRAFVAHYAVDPAANLRAYDVTQVEVGLRATLLPNAEDVIAHIDPLFATGSPILPEDVDNLTAFLVAQTSMRLVQKGLETESSTRLAPCDSIPWSVPSGLPIDGSPRDAGDCDDDEEDDD